MDEEKIIESIIELLKSKGDFDYNSAKVSSCYDFSEARTQNSVVVSHESTSQLNFQLKDYEYKITVLLDSYIDEDKLGTGFNVLQNKIQSVLEEYAMDKTLLEDAFPSLGIVYFAIEEVQTNIEDTSNQCIWKLDIIQSV